MYQTGVPFEEPKSNEIHKSKIHPKVKDPRFPISIRIHNIIMVQCLIDRLLLLTCYFSILIIFDAMHSVA